MNIPDENAEFRMPQIGERVWLVDSRVPEVRHPAVISEVLGTGLGKPAAGRYEVMVTVLRWMPLPADVPQPDFETIVGPIFASEDLQPTGGVPGEFESPDYFVVWMTDDEIRSLAVIPESMLRGGSPM